MNDISERKFSDIVYEKLEELNYEQTLSNPTTESNFPCIELHTPLKSILKTQNAVSIFSMFQISITCWNTKPRVTMDMVQEVEDKLKELNFIRTNISSAIYDAILQKYGITITFEVRYNSLTNSFHVIK